MQPVEFPQYDTQRRSTAWAAELLPGPGNLGEPQWGDSKTLLPGETVELIRLAFDRPRTVSLDSEWHPRLVGARGPAFGWTVAIGTGRASRVQLLDDLPRILTGQTIQVSATRLDPIAVPVKVSAWAAPQENARPALTVIGYVQLAPLAGFAPALTNTPIPLDAIPPDATHILLHPTLNVDNTSAVLLVCQVISGNEAQAISCAGTTAPRPVEILRQAERIFARTAIGLNLGGLGVLAVFLR